MRHMCAAPPGTAKEPILLNASRVGSLRPILHLAIAEGPVLTARIDEIDPHVFLSHPSLVMDLVGDLIKEFLLDLGRSPANPGHLNYDEIAGVAQTEISLLRVDHLVGLMTVDDLEFVMRRDAGDIHHGLVIRLAHDPDEFGRCLLVDVYSG